MLTLTFRPRLNHIPIEATCLRPDLLQGLPLDAIGRLPVLFGNRSSTVSEHFIVGGTADDSSLTLEGDCSLVKHVGSNMAAGTLVVHGSVGMHAGSAMRGGKLTVYGNASDWLGAGMKGGMIHVHGNAGHSVGGCYRGDEEGMTDGVILVSGNVGENTGSQMRRGLIAIRGNASDFTGWKMKGGTIAIYGNAGSRVGAGMKRGTIVLMGGTQPDSILPTFSAPHWHDGAFLSIYKDQLEGWHATDRARPVQFARYRGDLLETGLGEVLVNTESSSCHDSLAS